MKIYGVAILGGCFLVGQLTGDQLGSFLGIDGNVGGVGFGMLFLILVSTWMKRKKLLTTEPEKGILFWSAMYIPVVIAMSATQNVKAALSGGWVALLVGIIGTSMSFACIPIIAKIGKKKKEKTEETIDAQWI
jgi:malonate transporter MadL subunit